MFSKHALFTLAAAIAIVSAQDAAVGGGQFDPSTGSCNVGKLQCCNSVQTADSDAVQNQAGLLGVVIGAVQALVGLNCTPISVLGVGAGANCNATPVCCSGNTFGGDRTLIALGCNPININL